MKDYWKHRGFGEMKKVKILLSIVILFLFVVNYADSPLPAPYYKYYVGGTIKCDTMIDKSNYSIALFGKRKDFLTEYSLLNGMFNGNEKPVSLTNSKGEFFIIVSDHRLFDSLKVGWVSPHQSVMLSRSYFVDKSNLITETQTSQNNSSSGCSSCSTVEPTTETRIIRYNYHQYDTELNVCYK